MLNHDKSTFGRMLPCKLTDHELALKRDELADLTRTYDRVEEAKKAAAREYSERLKGLRGRMKDAAEVISERTEERMVDCYKIYNYRSGEVQVVRHDTGEVVSSRPMEDEERQQSIFGDDDELPRPADRRMQAANDDSADDDEPLVGTH